MDKLLRLLLLTALIGIVPSAVCIVGCGEDEKTVTGPEPIHYDDYIVYVGAYGITMITSELTDEQIIVPGTADDLLSPIWSPSKTEVVYVRINGSGEKQIELYRNDGSIDTLATGMIGKAPWSPDGTKITFARNDTVFVMNTRDSQPVSLMASAGDACFFDNNHVICYNFSGYWSSGSIYKISISDSIATKLFPQSQAGTALLRCPRVIPGDNSVAFGILDDDNFSERWNDFLKVASDGSDVTTITRIYTSWGLMILPKEMDISYNGDFILLVHNE